MCQLTEARMKGIYGFFCVIANVLQCVYTVYKSESIQKPATPHRFVPPSPPPILELATPLVLLPVERQRGTLSYILCEENREPWQHRLHLFNSVWALFTQPAAGIHHNTIQ